MTGRTTIGAVSRAEQREWNECFVEVMIDMKDQCLRNSQATKIIIDEGMYDLLKTSVLFNRNERQFNLSVGMPMVEMWREPIPMSEDCWAGSALFVCKDFSVHRVIALHYGV